MSNASELDFELIFADSNNSQWPDTFSFDLQN